MWTGNCFWLNNLFFNCFFLFFVSDGMIELITCSWRFLTDWTKYLPNNGMKFLILWLPLLVSISSISSLWFIMSAVQLELERQSRFPSACLCLNQNGRASLTRCPNLLQTFLLKLSFGCAFSVFKVYPLLVYLLATKAWFVKIDFTWKLICNMVSWEHHLLNLWIL